MICSRGTFAVVISFEYNVFVTQPPVLSARPGSDVEGKSGSKDRTGAVEIVVIPSVIVLR